MDAAQFDALIRSLSRGASRRGVLAGLTSGLLAVAPLRENVAGDEGVGVGAQQRYAAYGTPGQEHEHDAALPPCSWRGLGAG